MMRILVNAGPTREHIDTVRYISNASSGRMGYAIAARAAELGHTVTLVAGPVGLAPPRGVHHIEVVSAAEMFDACVRAFADCDAAVLTAAVCDYRPAVRHEQKLKKQAVPLTLALEPTPDIAAHLGAAKGSRVVVAFALEDHDAQAHAERKLREKQADAIILNSPDNIGGDHAGISILTADGQWSPTIEGTKDEVAAEILRLVGQLCRRT